jgi:hypothetical protein
MVTSTWARSPAARKTVPLARMRVQAFFSAGTTDDFHHRARRNATQRHARFPAGKQKDRGSPMNRSSSPSAAYFERRAAWPVPSLSPEVPSAGRINGMIFREAGAFISSAIDAGCTATCPSPPPPPGALLRSPGSSTRASPASGRIDRASPSSSRRCLQGRACRHARTRSGHRARNAR